MSASPAGGVDGAERSILKFDAENGGIVRIEHIFTDPIAGSFSEGPSRQYTEEICPTG